MDSGFVKGGRGGELITNCYQTCAAAMAAPPAVLALFLQTAAAGGLTVIRGKASAEARETALLWWRAGAVSCSRARGHQPLPGPPSTASVGSGPVNCTVLCTAVSPEQCNTAGRGGNARPRPAC